LLVAGAVIVFLSIVAGITSMFIPDSKPSYRPARQPSRIEPIPSSAPPKSESDKQAKRPADFDGSPQKQAERQQFIENLMAQGLVLTTEYSGSLPKLWVTSQFLALDEKNQNKFLSVVYAYWVGAREDFGGSGFFWDGLVIKIDNGTQLGKRIGVYDPIDGVKWND
jgi:hypothetical protein